MSLSDELRRVREYLNGENPPPSNEANTCNWVIWPLLLACGYPPYDIHAQGHDPAGKIPDYTILPNSPHTWFLEAKTWQEDIKDTHIAQASNYANAQGKRWFVVTNGRDWRLYDDHIIGVLPQERLVAAAKMDCEGELEILLDALSKNSVMTGNLKTFARKFRLNDILTQQMSDPRSEIFSAIIGLLKRKPGLHDVTTAEIMAHFHRAAPPSNAKPFPPVGALLPAVPLPPAPPIISLSQEKTMSLRELKQEGNGIQGRNPVLLIFPDAAEKQIATWRDMTIGIIEWLYANSKTPVLPFSAQKGGKRCFINNQPEHPDGTEIAQKQLKQIIFNGQTLYIHVNRSAPDFVYNLNVLCEEVGAAADGFRVTLK